MAVMIRDAFVALLVSFQHPPQLGELNPTPGAPPIKGNVGILPKVGNRDARPNPPFEHATLLSEPLGLSYVVSNVARTVVDRGVSPAWGRAWARWVRRRSAREKVVEKIIAICERESSSASVQE